MVARRHSGNADRSRHAGAGFFLRPPHGAAFFASPWPPLACMEMRPKSVSRQSLGAFAGWLSDDEPPGFPEHNERNDDMKL
jgi:hypothetical protein